MSVSPASFAQQDAQIRDATRPDIPIVCFANDWRGPPTSKHHIMRLYSGYTDVLWVEASGMRRPSLLRLHDIRRVVNRLARVARRPTVDHGTAGRLHVRSPFLLPFPASGTATRVNGMVLRRTVRNEALRSGWREPPLLWVYTPTVSSAIGGIPNSGVVYHCVDRWWAFSEYDPGIMRMHHERLCRTANVVFASSRALYDDCRVLTERVVMMPHGVDWEHFARAALQPPPRPDDLADVPGPVIGFFGLLHEWVDLGLIRAVAERFPEATVVLIGQVRVPLGGLDRLPNVRVLGHRPYERLPAYCAAFDVAILPFVLNELTEAVNPIKLWEYLSAFVDAVGRRLAGRDDLARGELARSMARHSWATRCAEMARHVQQARE
jgi:hypothetical protein